MNHRRSMHQLSSHRDHIGQGFLLFCLICACRPRWRLWPLPFLLQCRLGSNQLV